MPDLEPIDLPALDSVPCADVRSLDIPPTLQRRTVDTLSLPTKIVNLDSPVPSTSDNLKRQQREFRRQKDIRKTLKAIRNSETGNLDLLETLHAQVTRALGPTDPDIPSTSNTHGSGDFLSEAAYLAAELVLGGCSSDGRSGVSSEHGNAV